MHLVSDGHGPFGHHVSYFIELNFPQILKKYLKIALDKYTRNESQFNIPLRATVVTPSILGYSTTPLNVIDEVQIEDVD
jgi:hypothetical protein